MNTYQMSKKKKVTYKVFENEANTYYTYSVTLKENDEDTNEIDTTFIVKLGEGTNFELSFSVDN